MVTEASLNQSMEKAVKHYSSLFTLPSYKKLFLLLTLVTVGGGVLLYITLFPSSEGLIYSLVFGASLFSVTFVSDFLVGFLIFRHDPVYNSRRIMALSLFCWCLWFLFISIGIIVTKFFGSLWWVKLFLLGFSAVAILRLIVLLSTSTKSNTRIILASVSQPLACSFPFLMLLAGFGYSPIPFFYFFIFSLCLTLIVSLLFVSILNTVGMQTLGVPSLPLFKAFILNWIVDLNAPFEEFLEKLGESRNVEVSCVKFVSAKQKILMVVPFIHPGPFKNIGSSLFPSMLKEALEKKFECVACVPHGLLGHELDLASEFQNRKVIDNIVNSLELTTSSSMASPLVKASNRLATVFCQVFGDVALLSFTLAPKTTEDLPQELGASVCHEAEKYGLKHVIIVNAHNSINGVVDSQEALVALKNAAVACFQKAMSLKQVPFEIGAATFTPNEYSLADGMGLGGITVVVFKVGKQKSAYVVIDGNNMISGLREKILSSLNSIGIDDGEVFTTDTHAVNALVLNGRGYHPIGEAINHESLIGHIKSLTLEAMSKLTLAKVGYDSMTISDVKVIGEEKLETLCLLIDKTLQKAKKYAFPLFAVSGALLMLFLMFV